MPKIKFDDKSYIEITKSQNPGKIMISIAVKDNDNKLSATISSVEITEEQFQDLIKV
jgi:hypothetical protein